MRIRIADRKIEFIATLKNLHRSISPVGASQISVAPDGDINPATAVLLLDEFVKLKPKDWVALNAANSQVARRLIAIAKSRDLNVIGIVRRSECIPELELLGVDFVGVESPDSQSKFSV